MKFRAIIISVAAGATMSSAIAAQSKTGIRAIDFLNRTYAAGCYTGEGRKSIKVANGKFADGDDFFNVDEQVTYGDVNGDGKEDAIVRIYCGNSAGTYRDFEVDVFTASGKGAKLISRIDQPQMEADYKRTFRKGIVFGLAEPAPEIKAGRIEIGALTDGSFAGPANTTTFEYKLAGAKLVVMGKPKRKKNT
ncbi:MAG: hypothetical protein ABJA02_07150 [Acidobacteriota bacterium]